MNFLFELALATIFGGMMTFQLLFAPLVFIKLSMDIARPFIRAFFPFYFLYFGILTVVSTLLSALLAQGVVAWILGAITLGFVVSRQLLMPRANRATDNGSKKQFDFYHRLTVLINTLQLIAVTYVMYRV